MEIEIPEDPEEQIWTGIRIGADVESILMPRYARMPLVPIFEELPDDEFVALAREVEPVALSEGHELMTQNATERAVYLLVRGQAKAVSRRPDGAEVDLGVRAGPTVLGEMALLTTVPRRASITSLGPGLAWRMDAERLVELGHSQPGLIERLRTLVKQRLLGDLLRTSQVLSKIGNHEEVLKAFTVRTFGPNTEVFPQGAPAPGLFFMLHGIAEVWVESEDGMASRVAELTEGDAFGEMSLLTGEPTTASVQMPDGGIVLHLAPEAFAELRGEAKDLESGLTELMDVRKGELEIFLTETAEIEILEDVDEAWVVDGFGEKKD